MDNFDPKVLAVQVDQTNLMVHLGNDQELTLPLDRYSRLRDASEEARNDLRLIGRGQGIYWEAIDEDLSVASFLKF